MGELSDFFKNKKNLVSLLFLGILILAIPLGIKLIRQQQIIKSRAAGDPIVFTGPNVNKKDGNWTALKPQISLQITSPFGSPAPSAGSGLSGASVPGPAGSVPAGFSRVFTTSTVYNGNLGGLGGADAKCQDKANSVNLGGIWKAWLGDDNTSAASRLNHSSNPYKLLNGTVIANNWADLTNLSSSSLKSPINITESGNPAAAGNVWTGTGPDGSSSPPSLGIPRYNCHNWTDAAVGTAGAAGDDNEADRVKWTYAQGGADCSSQAHLYCFEQ